MRTTGALFTDVLWGLRIAFAMALLFGILLLPATALDSRVREMGVVSVLAAYACTALVSGLLAGMTRPVLTQWYGSAALGLVTGITFYGAGREFAFPGHASLLDGILALFFGVAGAIAGIGWRWRLTSR